MNAKELLQGLSPRARGNPDKSTHAAAVDALSVDKSRHDIAVNSRMNALVAREKLVSDKLATLKTLAA